MQKAYKETDHGGLRGQFCHHGRSGWRPRLARYITAWRVENRLQLYCEAGQVIAW